MQEFTENFAKLVILLINLKYSNDCLPLNQIYTNKKKMSDFLCGIFSLCQYPSHSSKDDIATLCKVNKKSISGYLYAN